MRGFVAALPFLLSPLWALPQQTGDPSRDYSINSRGSGQTSPVLTTVGVASSSTMLNLYATLDPGSPVLWLESASLNPGQLTLGPNSVDIGTAPTFSDLSFIGDGAMGGLWNSLFHTGADGSFRLSLTLPATMAGYSTHLAMAHLAASSPSGFWISQTHTLSFSAGTIAVLAQGPNSFNADPSSGFFQVVNIASQDSITQVAFDWAATNNPAQSTMVFDTDQTGMASRFDGGQSPVPGCSGTYRNGSDAMVGLDYLTTPPSPCDPAAHLGYIGSNGGLTTPFPEVKTIEFHFSPGSFSASKTFEFDVDTDGGLGVSGADMQGLSITITLSSGLVLQGFLIPSAIDPFRSELLFGV